MTESTVDYSSPASPVKNQEISFPQADPTDPYAIPAAMPSSADKEPRSFNPDDFPLPTRKQDDWRFTPLDRMEEFFSVFHPSGKTELSLTTVDGSSVPAGVADLRQTTTSDPQVGTVLLPSDRAAAVQWASSRDHAYVLTLRGTWTTPLVLKIQGKSLDMDAFQLSIIAAPESGGDLVIEHQGDARLAEGIEISTGANSHVCIASIQEWSPASKHVGNHRIHLGQGSSLRHCMVTLGADVARIRIDQDFDGPEGDINMLGIYFVEPGEHMEHRTMVVHNQPDCKSRVIYKGALEGKQAHSTWVGNALIQPTAPGTDSYELNRNLVLIPGAVADSEPNLEIENGNIVGAGHASSVGRFDDEELFYLQSRGVPEAEARKLVVRGFFGQLIEEIGIPSIASHLMDAVNRRLDAAGPANQGISETTTFLSEE